MDSTQHIGNFKAAVTHRRSGPARQALVDEVRRLIPIAEHHRRMLLRELGDEDPRVQRGNACAYGFAFGRVLGLIDALCILGYTADADTLAQEADDIEGVDNESN